GGGRGGGDRPGARVGGGKRGDLGYRRAGAGQFGKGLHQDIWRLGLGLFPKVVFGPHWDMLDTYIPGLQTLFAAAVPPDHRLFAVDERTAAVGDGTEWSVIGLGKARLHDRGEWREWGPGDSFSIRLDGRG